jgi:hypothetical protein
MKKIIFIDLMPRLRMCETVYTRHHMFMVLNEAQDIITFLTFKSQIGIARILKKTRRQEHEQPRKAMDP